MEGPPLGRLPQNALAERGARIDTQRPTTDSFTNRACEGRTGLPNRSCPRLDKLRLMASRADTWRSKNQHKG